MRRVNCTKRIEEQSKAKKNSLIAEKIRMRKVLFFSDKNKKLRTCKQSENTLKV